MAMDLSGETEAQLPVAAWEKLPDDTREHWGKLLTEIDLPPFAVDAYGLNASLGEIEAADVAAKLRRDPLLAGKVLAVANSAAMGLVKEVTSLERAVVHLGFNLVQTIILVYHLEGVLKEWPAYPRGHFRYVRKLSAGASVVAFNIARDVKHQDAAQIGTAALLSKVGAFLLGFAEPPPPAEYPRVANELERYKLEAATWGIASPVLSARLALHWGLPQPLPGLISRQWEPLALEGDERPTDPGLTMIAAGSVLAAGYLVSAKMDPQRLLERQPYFVFRENLHVLELYDQILTSWRAPRLQKELAAITA